MRYDGYGTSSFGGGLIFLALVIGGAALVILYILAHADAIKSALAEGVRLIIQGVAVVALFTAGGACLAAALVAHEPALADNGEIPHLVALMTLMLASAYQAIRWIIRRR